jgi:hypothetical protein
VKTKRQLGREPRLTPAAEERGSKNHVQDQDDECLVKLDRVVLFCDEDPTRQLMGVPGFKSLSSHFIRPYEDGRFQPYARVHWFKDWHSDMKLKIESRRREPWMPLYRITLYADDRVGLLPEQLFAVLEVIPRFKLSVIEIAFDFSPWISRTLLSQRVLFGKSRPAPPIETTLYWGSQKGSKGARLYHKEEIDKYRVELELHAKFLRAYQIWDIFDFQKFCELLPVRHIYYARFAVERLIVLLRSMGMSYGQIWKILRDLALLEDDVWPTLNYLRLEVGLKNARRLLVPLKTNWLIREALEKWTAMWPKAPTRLGAI